METILIGGIVGTFLTGLIISVVYRGAGRSRPSKVKGVRMLRYKRGFLFTGLIGLVFFASIGIACLIVGKPDDHVASLVFFGFAIVSLILLLETVFVRISFDAFRVDTRSPWRKPRSILWEDFSAGARFSSSAQWCVLPAGRHGKVRLSVGLKGLREFLDSWSDHTGHELANREDLEVLWKKFQ